MATQSFPQKRLKVPAHVPGQVITVSLDALPKYLEIHGLAPMTRGEVRTLELARREWKPRDVLWVKREAE